MTSEINLGEAKSNAILLDYDLKPSQVLRLIRRRARFAFTFYYPVIGRLQITKVNARSTHHGCHIRLYNKTPIPDVELNFIQAILGSDFRRECLNLRRLVELNDQNPTNVLFYEKHKARPDGYDVISREKPARRLTRQIIKIIKQSSKRKRTKKELQRRQMR